jgi:hypothetical protein
MILRHLEKADWARVSTLPRFDGFVFHSGQEDTDLRAAALDLAGTKAGYLYAQVLTRPPASWGNPSGAPWLDVVNALTVPLTNPDGVKAVAWAHGREMIDWHVLDGGKIDGLTDVIVAEVSALGLRGVLLDLSYFRPRDWMFRFDGPPYNSFPAAWWPYFERRFGKFVGLLAAKFNVLPTVLDRPRHILLEGERPLYPGITSIGLYREQAQLNWLDEYTAWSYREPGRDVLSVLADDTEAMYRLLAASTTHPDFWIAFTGHDPEATDLAYELAAEGAG